jgi:hypothetical protein
MNAQKYPDLPKNILQVVYNELESNLVSQWGCSAITAIAEGSLEYQKSLGMSSNYIGDILEAHKKDPSIAKEAVKCISVLAHANMINRNRLGATDACEELCKVLQSYRTHSETDKDITYWAVRAVADLAANNPNNQSKLGSNGACEELV